MMTEAPPQTGPGTMPPMPESRSGSGAGAPSETYGGRHTVHQRFDRVGRLLGADGLKRLFESHAMVIGVGGVGSFAAESLARSGVGELSLVDFDRVSITNSNRQLQALEQSLGRPKASVLGARLEQINPDARVRPLERFYCAERADELLGLCPDVVVDAVDNITAKCHLLAECRKRGIRVVSSLGAAGRIDPTALEVADLASSNHDPMARVIRKVLRQKYAFPRHGTFGIKAIYSREPPREPEQLGCGGAESSRIDGGDDEFHSCEKRRVIYGSASFVTGTFGLLCASEAVRQLLQ